MLLLLLLLSVSFGLGVEGAPGSTSPQPPRKLLLILLDGFRWNYVAKHSTKLKLNGFQTLASQGVVAQHMEAIYPSESYPGYYSIATGRYAESHGMVLNYMWDPDHNETFEMEPDPKTQHSYWWEGAEPLWVTAEKRGLKVAMFLWPGANVTIHGIRAQVVHPYTGVLGVDRFKKDLTAALSALENDDISLAQVYCEHADKVGHMYGPESNETMLAVSELDKVLDDLLNTISKGSLKNRLNVIIVSDHGMTASNSAVKVHLDKLIDPEDVTLLLDRGSHVGIYPVPGLHDKVYRDLKKALGIDVYKKEEIPERFHFKNHKRTPPLYVVAQKDYFIVGLNHQNQMPMDGLDRIWNGFHGYDPVEEDMRAIFMAWGPDLKKGLFAPPISIIDPYNLMMHLLNLEPLPNNGSWERVSMMLSTPVVTELTNGTISAIHIEAGDNKAAIASATQLIILMIMYSCIF